MSTFDASQRGAATFETLLTADQAYPVFEREFLRSQTEIWASFRVFDPTTKLRSDEARAIGETWLDLVMHTLQRGVRVHLVISDFDPIGAPVLHRKTWHATRLLLAAAELSGQCRRLRVIPAMHPGESGLILRYVLWPLILSRQIKAARWLNGLPGPVRRATARDMPGLVNRLACGEDGRYRPCLWPLPHTYPATHHQKIAVFDRERLYIGGLDLDERRYDSPDHNRAADRTGHDVQLLVDGPAVAEAQRHLETFLDITAGRRAPGNGLRHIYRTLSRRRGNNLLHLGPAPLVNEIELAHEHHAQRARQLIYMETQYFRDSRFARQLARLGKAHPELGLLLVLPGAPDDVAFDRHFGMDARYGEFLQARALKIVARAFGRRFLAVSAAQPRPNDAPPHNGTRRDELAKAPLIYIHAKVSIFDESAAMVSSANLNGRSLRWDTEVGLNITRKARVRRLKRVVMEHWLPDDAEDAFFDPGRAVDAWRRLAFENLRKPPENRRGFVLPYDLKAAEEIGADAPGVPEELV